MSKEYAYDLSGLALMVADMRHAQKEYFRTRSVNKRNEARVIERQVDERLKQIFDNQKELF